jgi:hypothetical protein
MNMFLHQGSITKKHSGFYFLLFIFLVVNLILVHKQAIPTEELG